MRWVLLCTFFGTACASQQQTEFVGRAPKGAPEFQFKAAWAPEWDWATGTRDFGAKLYSVVVSPAKMLELSGGINAWGLSMRQEPYVFFVREDVLNDPILFCRVSIHEMTHLMILWESNSMSGDHCGEKWQQLKEIQQRICGEAEGPQLGDCG